MRQPANPSVVSAGMIVDLRTIMCGLTVKIDGRTVRLRRAGPRVMQWAGRPSAPEAQALRWLGPDAAADAQVVSTLSLWFPDPVKRNLFKNSRDLPGWALLLARGITAILAVSV